MKKFYNKELKSAGFRIKSGMTGSEELGRSMVEMLGVLAVIGVLSVAGIAGYTTAMNKYRANELLNEASKRAAIVAMQIASGKTGEALSVDEFTQPSGYLFGVDKTYASGDKTFKLTLSKDSSGKIDDAICSQMKATTGDNTVMKITKDDCSELTFNADLSNTSETQTPPSCDSGKEWNGEECVPVAELYIKGTTADVHYNLVQNGPNCPDGYHWATSEEVLRDFNCPGVFYGIPNTNICENNFPFYGWLSDCSGDCSSAEYAHAMLHTSLGGDVVDTYTRSYGHDSNSGGDLHAVCRK